MDTDEHASLTAAGWYPDPADPDSPRQRYWDGSSWTDRYRSGSDVESTTLWVGTGAALLASAIIGALISDQENTAQTIGYAVGGFFFPILLALVFRFVYVKLRRDHRPVASPWLLVIALVISLLPLLGALGDSAEDAESSVAAARALAPAPPI